MDFTLPRIHSSFDLPVMNTLHWELPTSGVHGRYISKVRSPTAGARSPGSRGRRRPAYRTEPMSHLRRSALAAMPISLPTIYSLSISIDARPARTDSRCGSLTHQHQMSLVSRYLHTPSGILVIMPHQLRLKTMRPAPGSCTR
jgi:hypothetical protein